jgi:hypothetical protein
VLESKPAAGSWNLKVATDEGQIELDAAMATIDIPLTVTSVEPNTELFSIGGDTISIVGDNFGTDCCAVSVSFDGVACDHPEVSMNLITCKTNPFNVVEDGASVTVTVTVNGVVDESQSVTVKTALPSALSMSPTSVSPVLKSEVDIVLSADFADILTREEFQVRAVSSEDESVSISMYVMSVDPANIAIKAKFPGAKSGSYRILIDSATRARVDCSALTLLVQSTVTNFSPKTGSRLGGTVITIEGENFSTNKLYNPVKVGDNYCAVLESSTTEIKC